VGEVYQTVPAKANGSLPEDFMPPIISRHQAAARLQCGFSLLTHAFENLYSGSKANCLSIDVVHK